MNKTSEAIKEYAERLRECSQELIRDPYLALVNCLYTSESLRSDNRLIKYKDRIEKHLNNLKTQAQSLWEKMIS